jgi:hypothetical protein
MSSARSSSSTVFADTEAQMVAQAVASAQENLRKRRQRFAISTEEEQARKRSKSEGVTSSVNIFGVVVMGLEFSFYRFCLSESCLDGISNYEELKQEETIVYRVITENEKRLKFVHSDDRRSIIRLLDRIQQAIMI